MEEWTITQQHIKIGRGENNDIRISSIGVSQDHCQVDNVAEKLLLLNMCRNTWIDTVRLETGVYVEIKDRNEIAIGSEVFKFIPVDATKFIFRKISGDAIITVKQNVVNVVTSGVSNKRRIEKDDDNTEATKRKRQVDLLAQTEDIRASHKYVTVDQWVELRGVLCLQ